MHFAVQGMSSVLMLVGNKFIASFILDIYHFAALGSIMCLDNINFGFAMGISATMASEITNLIVSRDLLQAKKYIKLSLILIFAIGVIVCIT